MFHIVIYLVWSPVCLLATTRLTPVGSAWEKMFKNSRFQKMTRPKTAGERNVQHMMDKARKEMERTKDPVEKLRCFCLSRGANGILGLGR